MPDAALLIGLGLIAGSLTTVAGMGGGLLLVVALSVAWTPAEALACTAVALLFGNVHRVALFRQALDRRVAGAFIAGAVPGAFAGAWFAVSVPARIVHLVMAGVTLLAVLRSLGKLEWTALPAHLAPGGLIIGVLTGAAGGAGVLAGPLFLAAGLTGQAYVATTSAVAAAMHTARSVGYGWGGYVTGDIAARAVILAVCIVSGNFVGRWVRRVTEKAPPRSIETVTLLVCVALALVGVAR